jgi:hypothetical protein
MSLTSIQPFAGIQPPFMDETLKVFFSPNFSFNNNFLMKQPAGSRVKPLGSFREV